MVVVVVFDGVVTTAAMRDAHGIEIAVQQIGRRIDERRREHDLRRCDSVDAGGVYGGGAHVGGGRRTVARRVDFPERAPPSSIGEWTRGLLGRPTPDPIVARPLRPRPARANSIPPIFPFLAVVLTTTTPRAD